MKRSREGVAGDDDGDKRLESSARVPAQASASIVRAACLVSAGTGGYMVLPPPEGQGNEHFMAMDKGDLLEAIASSRRFSRHMGTVSLSDCVVMAVTSMADDEPSADDLARQQELKGSKTLRSLLAGSAGNVFVEIRRATSEIAAQDLTPPPSLAGARTAADINSMVTEIAALVDGDIVASSALEEQRVMTGLGALLIKPWPTSRLEGTASGIPALATEFLPYVGNYAAYRNALDSTNVSARQQRYAPT